MVKVKRYKAAILPYVLVITLAGGIIVSSIMLRFYLSLKESDLLLNQWIIEKDLNSVLNYGMHQEIFSSQWEDVHFSTTLNSNARFQNDHWGIYGLTKVEVERNKSVFKRAALWGRKSEQSDYSLYLADLKQHFSVCGNTVLEGLCYLPEAGVRHGYIEGKSFSGSLPDQFSVKHAQRELPALDQNYWKSLCKRFGESFSVPEEIIQLEQSTDTLINSFFEPTIRIKSTGSIVLDQGFYEGNIIVESAREIIVKPGFTSKGIVLIAPHIQIDSNNGSYLQAFARETILLKENSRLEYPSAFCLIRDKQFKSVLSTDSKLVIDLEKNTHFKGILLAVCELYEPTHPILIKVGEASEVEGEVYSSRMAEVKGTIKGNLACEEFYLQTQSSSYKNHLLDARISILDRNPWYSGLPFQNKLVQPSLIQFVK